MSYEIFYDKAFIKVGDRFIPLVNQGSNNCFEFGLNGREIPEKNWNILNFRCRSKVLFTENEINELAEHIEEIAQKDGTIMKSRYRAFAPGELRGWFIAGMKRAYTVEEYVKCGNMPYFVCHGKELPDKVAFTTTAQLEELIAKYADVKEVNIAFANNRTVYRPKLPKPDKLAGLEKAYVLGKKDDGGRYKYLCRFRKRRYTFATDLKLPYVRLFATEKEIRGYLQKNREKLASLGLEVLCVDNPRLKREEMTA